MNNNYWEQFYKGGAHIKNPSAFAKFVRKFIKDKDLIVFDLGCGNGRDSYYLGKKWTIIGIDIAIEPMAKKGVAVFSKDDVNNVVKDSIHPNLIYARFFIHSIDDELFNKILEWGKDLIAIEVRSPDDNRQSEWIYKDHNRELRTSKQLISMLHKNNYKLIYFLESRGLAKYKKEDPLIIRIIAKKNVI